MICAVCLFHWWPLMIIDTEHCSYYYCSLVYVGELSNGFCGHDFTGIMRNYELRSLFFFYLPIRKRNIDRYWSFIYRFKKEVISLICVYVILLELADVWVQLLIYKVQCWVPLNPHCVENWARSGVRRILTLGSLWPKLNRSFWMDELNSFFLIELFYLFTTTTTSFTLFL